MCMHPFLACCAMLLAGCHSVSIPFVQSQVHPTSNPSQEPGQDSDPKAATDPKALTTRSYMLWHFGIRNMNSSNWDPVGRQYCMAGEIVWRYPASPWGIESAFSLSLGYEEEMTTTAYIADVGSTIETSIGVCYELPIGDGPACLLAGVGPSWISAALTSDRISNPAYPDDFDDDTAWGLYTHLSLFLDLGDFRFGVDLRALNFTRITLFDNATTADYTQATVWFGYLY